MAEFEPLDDVANLSDTERLRLVRDALDQPFENRFESRLRAYLVLHPETVPLVLEWARTRAPNILRRLSLCPSPFYALLKTGTDHH